MRKLKLWQITLLVILAIFLAFGATVLATNIKHYIDAKKVVPHLDDSITDVRVGVQKRELKPVGSGAVALDGGLQALQIVYSYEKDGKWYDIPCENYDLVGLAGKTGCHNYEAANGSHLVKIGRYVLIHYECPYFNNKKNFFEVTDTLNSKVLEPFTEYYTDLTATSGSDRYAYVKEDLRAMLEGGIYNYHFYGKFNQHYYLLLKIDELPDDYKITVMKHTDKSVSEYTHLTKDRLLDLIGE